MNPSLNTKNVFCRKCQECGHIQPSKPITDYKGDSWTDMPCRKCRSSALDYGHDNYEYQDGKLIRSASSN
jgi:hypothetical protein